MWKYFCLQFKRIAGTFSVILVVTVVLVLGASVLISAFSDAVMNGEENTKFKIALCGDTEGDYIELGLRALQTIDDTRFSIDVVLLEEDEAAHAIKHGVISAYVVMPENFVENALNGIISPVTFVTTPGQNGIVTMFKNEITNLITDLVVYSEKGTYAIYNALRENGAANVAYEYMNTISIEYAELVFGRGDVYSYKSVGVSRGLGMGEYYTCALSVFLIMLTGITFASVHIRRDRSLDRILLSRGYSERAVLGCEYILHSLCMIVVGVLCLILMVTVLALDKGAGVGDLIESVNLEFILRLIPVIFMISALNILIFETQDNIVGGVFFHFFIVLFMGYASGCMYPIYALPSIMQKVALLLPSGVAHTYLGGVFTYDSNSWYLFGIVMYTMLFFLVAYILRVYKTRRFER